MAAAGVSKEEIRKDINAILKNADLTEMSAKKVRLQLEKKYNCDLTSRKKEIDQLVMDFINSKSSDDDSESEEESKPSKRSSTTNSGSAKKKQKTNDSSESEESDDDYKPKKNGSSKAKKASSSDSDSDAAWKKPKKAPAKKTKSSAGGSGKGKGTGFTRACTLSADLAALMGAESLPRHEVVKKMWARIKEKNLYDPKNKQFAICDTEMHKIMGVKRFRTFGMLKYLKPHFLD